MAKIGDKFTFVGQITAKQEKKMGSTVGLKVKLKERDGREFDWTSFSVSAFDGFQIDDFVRVEGFYTENTKGKHPYHNIETDTPIEKASESEWSLAPRPNAEGVIIQPGAGRSVESGPTSSPPGGLASHNRGNGESPDRSASIERQSSVIAASKVCEIIATHYSEYYTDLTQVLTHAEENMPQFLRLAGSMYDYYSNRAATDGAVGINQAGQPIDTPTKAVGTAQGHARPSEWKNETVPYEPSKLNNIGDVLFAAHRRWDLSQSKVCDFFGVDSPTEIRNSYTFSDAWEALLANYDGPDGRE